MPTQDAQIRVRAVAERQSGAISYAQLSACGLTHAQIATMIRRGYLLRVFRGVYLLGHRRVGRRGELFAAELAAGPGAFLSCRSGAAARGLCRHPPQIELTVNAQHTPPGRRGLRIHRTTIPTDRRQATRLDGLLVATVPRIIVDLSTRERPGELERLVRQSIRTGQFDLAALSDAVDGVSTRPGTGIARAILQRYLPGSENRRSWLETQFQRHERGDPRLPTPDYNVHLFGYEVDVAWPLLKVALELDGRPYHVAVEDFDRDRGKDRTFIRHSWRLLRVSDFEWEHDRAAVLDDVYAILGV